MKRYSYTRAISIFTLIALFLVYEMGMQVSPSIITDQLMIDLHLNAVQLGVMGGFYYYTYTLMQIPAGLLFDRFTVRSVTLIPLLICATGAYLFSIADTLQDGSIARMFMGAGAAFAFIGVLVVAADLFPKRHFAMLAGFTQLLAAVGALGGELPLLKLIEYSGWRDAMQYIAIMGFVLAFFIWIFVRYNKTFPDSQQRGGSAWRSIKVIFSNPQTWIVAFYACLQWAPMAAFASFWGIPYLMKAHGVSRSVGASLNSMMWVGIGIGSPILGWWSDYIGYRRIPLVLSATLGLIAISCVLFIPHLPIWLLGLLITVAGAACSGQVLSFAVVRENNLQINHAAAIGFNNMAVVIAGAMFQPLVGQLIHWHWLGTMVNGMPQYSALDYRYGITVLPMCYTVSILIALFLIKETYCQPHQETSTEAAPAIPNTPHQPQQNI